MPQGLSEQERGGSKAGDPAQTGEVSGGLLGETVRVILSVVDQAKCPIHHSPNGNNRNISRKGHKDYDTTIEHVFEGPLFDNPIPKKHKDKGGHECGKREEHGFSLFRFPAEIFCDGWKEI